MIFNLTSFTFLTFYLMVLMTVRDILAAKKRNVIYAVRPHHTVLEGLRIMAKHNVGSLMVVDEDEKLVGIFTERDYARKGILKGKKAKSSTISELMTPNVITVSPEENIRECFEKVSKGHFRHLPVMENGSILGMLSIGDLVEARLQEQRNHIRHLQDMITMAA